MKSFRKILDRLFGPLTRSIVRNAIAHPFFACNYTVEIIGAEQALSCDEGASVIANHVSFIDGPLLMSMAWPHGRVRPCVWYKEYFSPFQWPLMMVYGAIPVGSPTLPPKRWLPHLKSEDRERLWKKERERRKRESMDIMCKILERDGFPLIFAEGGIGDGEKVLVNEKLTGAHDLIKANPYKPVITVKIEGLEHSRFGKKKPRAPLFRKLHVKITVKRFDTVSLEGGPAAFNRRIQDHFNLGTLLAENA